jgi:hypothetical protein
MWKAEQDRGWLANDVNIAEWFEVVHAEERELGPVGWTSHLIEHNLPAGRIGCDELVVIVEAEFLKQLRSRAYTPAS